MRKSSELVVLPCERTDDRLQRCWLGPGVMQEIGAIIGSSIQVNTHKGSFICSAWPRLDGVNQFIQYSTIVKLNGTPTDEDNLKSLTISQIKVLKSETIKKASVIIVAADYTKVAQFEKSLHSNVRNMHQQVLCILRNTILIPNCTVNCSESRIGKLFGISHIIISTVEGYNLNFESGKVASETQFAIMQVMSRECLEQKNRKVTAIGGLDKAFQVLRDVIQIPLRYADVIQKNGIQCVRGVFIRGPSGTGKTSLVNSVAHKLGAYLLTINGAEIFGSRPGDSETKLRELFDKAVVISKETPVVIFIDEVDAMCPRKGKGGGSSQERRTVAQLTRLLDDLPKYSRICVVGATNRPQVIDTALQIPGRLEKEVILGIPTLHQRQEILKVLLKHITLKEDVDIKEIAQATPGYVGADLASLVQYAVYDAAVKDKQKNEVIVSASHFQVALHNMVPSTQRGSDILVDHHPVSWKDVGGLQEVKQQLKQAVEWPMKHPDSFARLGIPCPKGVLLYGPPGCAKTTLVRAAATACHATFLSINGAQLYSPFVGDSERKIREVFLQARAGAPSILFLDEIDSIVGKRSIQASGQQGVKDRVLSALLNEMDGIGQRMQDLQKSPSAKIAEGETIQDGSVSASSVEPVDNAGVLFVAATNRPDLVDDALLRPGRIDRLIYVPPPDAQARHDILRVLTRNTPLDGVDLADIAGKTEGYTGADLENLCREAALYSLTKEGLDSQSVNHTHFLHALAATSPSLKADVLKEYDRIASSSNR